MDETTATTPATEYTIPGVTEHIPDETTAETQEPEPGLSLIIQQTGLDIIHADLFGSFLICGTLVGIFLLRGRYGT